MYIYILHYTYIIIYIYIYYTYIFSVSIISSVTITISLTITITIYLSLAHQAILGNSRAPGHEAGAAGVVAQRHDALDAAAAAKVQERIHGLAVAIGGIPKSSINNG